MFITIRKYINIYGIKIYFKFKADVCKEHFFVQQHTTKLSTKNKNKLQSKMYVILNGTKCKSLLFNLITGFNLPIIIF